METTFVTEFYRAAGAAERKKLLEQSVQAGEEPEKNGIREELFSLRYQQQKSRKEQEPIDALLRVWMTMELNRQFLFRQAQRPKRNAKNAGAGAAFADGREKLFA